MPLDSAAKLAFVDKNVNLSTTFNFNKSYSKSSFLILKNGNDYSAYIMTIVADSAYLKNDFSKLSNNTYRKHDKDFSGDLIYYTPKGEFVSGWHYSNGKINKTISITKIDNDGLKTQSLNDSKLKALSGCSVSVSVHLTIGYINGSPSTYFYDFTIQISCPYVPEIDPRLDGDGDDGYNPPPGGGGSVTTTTTQTQQVVTTDTSILNKPKLNCINGKLANNTVYKNLIDKFLNSSTYNLIIQAAPLNGTNLGLTTYNSSLRNGDVTITINSNQVDLASAIDLATTFIHEAFHAFIAQNLIQRNLMGTNVYNQTYADTFDQYVTAQVDSVRSARIALNQPFDSNTVSHDIIAANIDVIANGIKQYAELAWPALKTNSSITFDNYRATAWASKGLAGSTSYAKEFDTPAKISDLNQNRNLLTQNTTNDCN